MKLLLLLSILLSFLVSTNAYSERCSRPDRVAIIDTGLDIDDPRFSSLLCKDGHHWDFVENKPLKIDGHGHGTHIAGLIKQYAGNANYCLLIYRYFSAYDFKDGNLRNEIMAIDKAVADRATIINISGGGLYRSDIECNTIKEAKNVRFVTAAGNEGSNIDPPNGYYPASCGSSNITIVGSTNRFGLKMPSSNYGTTVTEWELGLNVESTLPKGRTGEMSGTSMATAIATGKAVSKNKCEESK